MTQEEIKDRMVQYEEIINDTSEDQSTRDFAQKKWDKLNSQITESTVEVKEVEEVEEVEEVKKTPKAKPKAKKKAAKKKGRGRPKKRGRPAKRKSTPKATTTKTKAKKMSKDLGLTIKECEDLLAKYNKDDKARKERLSKRKKAGKNCIFKKHTQIIQFFEVKKMKV